MASSTRPGTARSCPRSDEVVRMWGSLNLLPVTVVDLPFTDLICSSYRLTPKKRGWLKLPAKNTLFWKAQVPPHYVFGRHRDGGGIVVNKIGSLRSTTRGQRQRHKFCIFNDKKQNLCTPFTCFFYFCTFLSRSRQMCDVKWPFLKFYREREHSGANLNIIF